MNRNRFGDPSVRSTSETAGESVAIVDESNAEWLDGKFRVGRRSTTADGGTGESEEA